MIQKTKPHVGQLVWLFLATSTPFTTPGQPLPATVASIDETTGSVSVSYVDQSGGHNAQAGITFDGDPTAGSYAIAREEGESPDKAIDAHVSALRAGKVGQPAGEVGTEAAAARAKEKIEGGGTPGRESRSAALGSGNVQPAGSGGPFDPANTSKAHMSEHQMRESESPGHPTTGGMTPKISADTVHLLSEKDRETLQRIDEAGSEKAKEAAATAGSGVVTAGSAKAIRAAEQDQRRRSADAADAKARQEAAANTQAAEQAAIAPGSEADRIAKDEARHKEALEVSQQRTADRKKADPVAAEAAKKAVPTKPKPGTTAAKTGSKLREQDRPGTPAKKTPAKKTPAKKTKRR